MTLEDKIRSGRMTFSDAMQAVAEGYAVRRAVWTEGEYVTLSCYRELEKVTDEGRKWSDYAPISVTDITSDDWQTTGELVRPPDSGRVVQLDEKHRDMLLEALRSGERGRTQSVEYEGIRIDVLNQPAPDYGTHIEIYNGPIGFGFTAKNVSYDFGQVVLSDGMGKGNLVSIAVDPYVRDKEAE